VKTFLIFLSIVALALTILPPCVQYSTGALSDERLKLLMLAGTLLWFATATPLSLWSTAKKTSHPRHPGK
jgi:hypothetical protein